MEYAAEMPDGIIQLRGAGEEVLKPSESKPTLLRTDAGAKFGLYMPGKPNVGMSYYQEIAPGAGKDRADVVSVSETVITPAGKFENCVHTIETSPIEKTLKDHKWYAPGVGTRGWSAIGR